MKKTIIKIITLALILSLVFCAGFSVVSANAANIEVDIKDENLKNIILNELELSTDTITVNDMKNLERIETLSNDPQDKVASLEGLEYATRLTYLDLNYSKVTDLTPIKDLTELKHLDISYNNGAVEGTDGITDISILKNLTKLEYFSAIGDSGIEDFSVIGNFTKLEYLNLSICGIDDISFVENLVNLKKLYLVFNDIVSVLPLKNLTNLEKLALGSNNIFDISFLKNLTNLTQFTVENNNLTDVSVVYNFTKLTKLDISRNYLSDETLESVMENVQADSVIISPVKEGEPPVNPYPDGEGNTDNNNPSENGGTTEPPTDTTTKKSGCGGDIFSLSLILPITILAYTILRKKGKNEND